MSSAEFVQWAAWFNMEPRGEFRADIREAHIAFTKCRYLGGDKIGMKDFILDFDKGRKEDGDGPEVDLGFALYQKFAAMDAAIGKTADDGDRCGSDTIG